MKVIEILPEKTFLAYQPIFACLRCASFEIRLVGGAIRNAMLGRNVAELDFAAQCSFEELVNFCRENTFRIITQNAQHGSIKILLLKHIVDITILRQDVTTDGRHATITTTDDWLEDAKRRDFTINALYADLSGKVSDPLSAIGQSALDDLENHLLRFIDDSDRRIQEDYLRILRLFRFQAILGFSVLADDLKTIALNLDGLKQISRERISAEWLRLVMADHPLPSLRQMQEIGLLRSLWPDCPVYISGFEELLEQCRNLHYTPPITLRLATLHQDTPPDRLKANLVLAKKDIQTITQIRQPYGKSTLHEIYYFSQKIASQRALFHQKIPNKTVWDHLLAQNPPIFPINGRNLQQKGLKNQEIGVKMKLLEEIWLESGASLSKQELLQR